MLKDIYQLTRMKDTAVLLGCGPTINDIDTEEWERIKKCDMWAMNNWVFHPDIVPDFYHVEVKGYGYAPLRRTFIKKRKQYETVNFIFPSGKYVTPTGSFRVATHAVLDGGFHKYLYEWTNRETPKDSLVNAKYEMPKELIYRHYKASLPSILEIMYKMGYKYIYLYGIEFINSFYFYTGGDPKYGEVYHQTNKAHEGKDPNRPHNTHRLKDFVVDFNKQHMIPNGKELFVGTTESALYPELKYQGV